jgi:hypothetical protein
MAHVKNCHVGTNCSKHDYNLSCRFGLHISSDRFVLNVQKTDWGNISKVIITLDIWGGPFKHILFRHKKIPVVPVPDRPYFFSADPIIFSTRLTVRPYFLRVVVGCCQNGVCCHTNY